ncbi:bacteriocin-protection protein [Leptospira tipperaryensis]|uniref:Bacteriocin-protection protein n=1 Tax=Leptospira tipperaryensis TaxID=2564040 RepID=A0A1D7USS1_9LEPT|nr:YdeI/OmpD-associated family protein [Leptospira tipperaryensis]AOP32660.1 bacteriocin-protection protein [Leptospira tipperaryensis]
MIEFNSPTIKKMKFKNGDKVFVFSKNEIYSSEPIEGVKFIDQSSEANGILLFVDSSSSLKSSFSKIKKNLKENVLFWVAYPKKSSGIQTDLERDHGWEPLSEENYDGVALVSLNETWSAMRFKKKDKVKKGGSKEEKQKKPGLSKYINYEKKTVRLPEDVLKTFSKSKSSKESFETLSWSHQREYVESILEAKTSETRTKRILKLMDHLNSKKPKKPSSKKKK